MNAIALPVTLSCTPGFYRPVTVRERIEKIEARMLALPQVEIETRHIFAAGLYAREIFIPKGTLLTGKIHKHEHLNFISKGDISVLTEHGVRRVQAPFSMVSLPGTKRVGFAHEDTVWTTVHATTQTDLDKLEHELIAKSFDDVALLGEDVTRLGEVLKLEGSQCPG